MIKDCIYYTQVAKFSINIFIFIIFKKDKTHAIDKHNSKKFVKKMFRCNQYFYNLVLQYHVYVHILYGKINLTRKVGKKLMKKSIKVIALTALAAGMLAGCSSGGPVEPNWNWQDRQAMKENLHGYVLPYVKGVSDLEVEVLESVGYVIVSGGEISSEDLAVYASNFKAEDGWVDLYAEEAEPEPEPEPEPDPVSALRARLLGEGEEDPVDPEPEPEPEPVFEYMFEKRFEIGEGGRYVHVEFGSYDLDDNPAEGGNFVLYALDPYEYSFPRDDIDAATLAMGSTISVPSLEADHYRFYDRDGLTAVLCYLDSEEPDAGYCKILEAAGFYVYPPEEYEGDVYYLADSADEKYGLICSWIDDMFVIQLASPLYSHSFPSAELNAIAEETFGSSVEVVPFEEALYYDFREEYDAAFCYGVDPETAALDYTEALEAAGWHVYGEDPYEEFYFADAPDFSYCVYYNVLFDDVLVVALASRVSVEEFPAEDFGVLTDYYFYSEVVPASIEADYYFFSYAGLCACFGLSEAEAEGYGDLLEAEGWVVSFYTEELYEDGPIAHFAWAPLDESWGTTYNIMYYYQDGVLVIGLINMLYFQDDVWNADAIAEIFTACEETQYDVPAFVATSEETWFQTELYLSWGLFPAGVDVYVVNYTDDDVETYLDALEAAGWEIVLDEEYGDYTATKAFPELKGIATIQIMFYAEDGYIDIYMSFGLDPIPSAEFPAEAVAAFLASEGFTETIPAFTSELATGFEFADTYRVKVTVESGDEEAALAAYLEDLEAAGWTEFGPDSYGDMQYIGPTGELLICPWLSSYGQLLYIDFYEAPSAEWPAEDIADFLAYYGITAEVPAFSNTELMLGVEFDSYYGYIQVSTSDGAQALTSYVADLTAAGWEEYGEDDYGDMQYIGPTADLLLTPYYYGTSLYIGFASVPVAPEADWPAEDIAATLSGLGATETLPAFEGEADGFNWYSSSLKLVMTISGGDEAEDAAVESYVATLLAAGWTEAGPDSYGDMHYTSPNGELDVCPWAGYKWGNDGYVVVDVALNSNN